MQADVMLKDQGISELAWAQRAGVQGTGIGWSCTMSGQVGPEAALGGEGTATKLARERTLTQMCGLV